MLKYVFYLIMILFTFVVYADDMNFGDGESMDFGSFEEETKDSKKSDAKVKEKKKNKDEKKEAKKDEGAMDFGSGDEMNFGDDSMVFDEEEGEKIKQDEMRFDFNDDKVAKLNKVKKEEVVVIKKKPQTYIERGAYFKLSYGPSFMIGSPKVSELKLDEKELFGSNFKMAFGVDIIDLLSLELYGQMIMHSGKAKGAEDILYSRDVTDIVSGLGINLNFYLSERFNININTHGGALFLEDEFSFAVGGGIGIEYHLLLRHFSILFSLDGDYYRGLDTITTDLMLAVKYTF